ncbi:MAG: hypothetical protein AB1689_01090, partial [Thermodesulfobacteriota bacterium]
MGLTRPAESGLAIRDLPRPTRRATRWSWPIPWRARYTVRVPPAAADERSRAHRVFLALALATLGAAGLACEP